MGLATYVATHRDRWFEKRVKVVVAGRLIRGAWQHQAPLRRIIAREGIRTIVTLTAINSTDPKFAEQAKVVREMGVRWLIVPMRGSRATPEQLALAADLMADRANQPVFFHCVAGHHRTSLAHAAYRIRHQGYSAEVAWQEISSLPWSRPDSPVDRNDRFLIEEFARIQRSLAPTREHGAWEIADGTTPATTQATPDRYAPAPSADVPRLESGDLQLRRSAAEARLPIGADAGVGPRQHPAQPSDQDRREPARAQSG
jgi:protein tyrosine phosphatase (PTP) superfamily phosphohydrolase (DUF442 family)